MRRRALKICSLTASAPALAASSTSSRARVSEPSWLTPSSAITTVEALARIDMKRNPSGCFAKFAGGLAMPQQSLGHVEVGKLIDFDGFAGSGEDGAAVGAEESVGIVRRLRRAHERVAGGGDHSAIVQEQWLQVLAAVNAAGMQGDHFVA